MLIPGRPPVAQLISGFSQCLFQVKILLLKLFERQGSSREMWEGRWQGFRLTAPTAWE